VKADLGEGAVRMQTMTATQNQELVDIFNRVKDWPLDMRITLARRILETTETPPIAEPPRTLSLDQVIGILKTGAPPPTDEDCERIIEDERMRKYG
jgi:hypothetical protein